MKQTKFKKKHLLMVIIGAIFLYFSLWPVDIDPVAWKAPIDRGYTGVFQHNEALKIPQKIDLHGFIGPEDIALDNIGRIYAATHQGIVRIDSEGSSPTLWAHTGGRPLGIEFDNHRNLIVADGFKGLLSISPNAEVSVLTNSVDDFPIGFADDVDVADNGLIYFSDASIKFSPRDFNDVLKASELDVIEHGGHGRLLRYDPLTQKTEVLMSGLNFANGVTISHDQSYVLINDMGNYQVLKYWIEGDLQGTVETILHNLPGFPDNITSGLGGRFWISLIKPRNKDLDKLSNYPFLRKIAVRLLPFYKPHISPYAHVIAIDGKGNILQNLQNSKPSYIDITTVRETEDSLFFGSLVEDSIGRILKKK
jgi:sugar lactone lactonase YvrE